MGIGISEIILIIVVGYFLFGPEKLPKVIAEFMKTINTLLKMKDDILSTVTDIKKDIEVSVAEVKNDLNTAATLVKTEIAKPISEIEKTVNESIEGFNESVIGFIESVDLKFINHPGNVSMKEINKS